MFGYAGADHVPDGRSSKIVAVISWMPLLQHRLNPVPVFCFGRACKVSAIKPI